MSRELSMKALEELTGINRQTVHHWLRERVLPPPVRGAGTRNARYSERHAELIGLVTVLRAEGLSLEAVRRRFAAVDFEPGAVLRAPGKLDLEPVVLVDASRLAEHAHADPALVEALLEAGLLTPEPGDPTGRVPATATDMVRAARDLESTGLTREVVVAAAQHGQQLAWMEVEALSTAGARTSAERLLAPAERRFGRMSALVNVVRREALCAALRRLSGAGDRALAFAQEAVYVPSELFAKRWRLDEELSRARAAVEAHPKDAAGRVRIGRLLLGLGRYAEGTAWLARAAQLAPDHPEALSYLGLARALGGAIARGLDDIGRAVKLAPESPRAVTFHGVVLALHAALTTGLENPSAVMRKALVEVSRSAAMTGGDPRDVLEARLARGRVLAMLPGDPKARTQARTDLHAVLEQTTQTPCNAETFDFPGAAALYQINALYYLGVDALEAGERDQARAWLHECIALDPASTFAEAAYTRLGG